MLAVLVGAVASYFAWGPAPPGGGASTPAPVGTTYDPETGRLQELTYDRNNDGSTDAWLVMNGSTLLRADMDETFDGVIDRREHYAQDNQVNQVNQGAEAPSSVPVMVELLDPERGTVSRREEYASGMLQSAEEDTNNDGVIDKWETYEAGALRRVELDEAGQGRPTRRLVYHGGERVTVELDDDGDGTFEPVTVVAAPSPSLGDAGEQ